MMFQNGMARVHELEEKLDSIEDANLTKITDFYTPEPKISIIVKPSLTDVQRHILVAAVSETVKEYGLRDGEAQFDKIEVNIFYKR